MINSTIYNGIHFFGVFLTENYLYIFKLVRKAMDVNVEERPI